MDLRLKILSTFDTAMTIESVSTVPPDPRFYFRAATEKGESGRREERKIVPEQKSFIGKMIFDPGRECREEEECYVGFDVEESRFGIEWLTGLSLPQSMAESDSEIAQALHKRGLEELQPSSAFNVTLRLDTDQVRGFLIHARAALVWPRVVKFSQPDSDKDVEESNSTVFQFPLTQVGNSSFRDLLLSNPSQQPLLVHLVPLSAYPSGARAAGMLPTRSKLASPVNYTTAMPLDTFSVHSVVDGEDKSSFKAFSEDLFAEEDASSAPCSSSLSPESLTKAFILPPGRTARVRLRFRPPNGAAASAGEFNSALFVRNNLTGVEAVDLSGRSVFGSLSFAGWKSGRNGGSGSSILRFEVQEKHLKDCDRKFFA